MVSATRAGSLTPAAHSGSGKVNYACRTTALGVWLIHPWRGRYIRRATSTVGLTSCCSIVMSELIVLVTGANTGIGYEVVKALLQSSKLYKVILSGRSIDKVHDAAARVKQEVPDTRSSIYPLQLDITDDTSLNGAVKQIKHDFGHIDTLVNNAGASFEHQMRDSSMTVRQAFNAAWDVNVTSTHVLTLEIAPLLIKSKEPRLIFVTSGASSLEGTLDRESEIGKRLNSAPPPGWPKTGPLVAGSSYRAAKTGLNMLMRDWEKTLANDGVKVFAVAPGFLATNLTGDPAMLKKMGAGDASLGGISLRKVIEGERDADAGLVVRNYGTPTQPW